MTIEFLVCTIDQRIEHIKDLLLPPMEGVRYLVSWQHSNQMLQSPDCSSEDYIPNFFQKRTDVRIVEINGRGLASNRNNALKHASGDVLVISDDDCRYTLESIQLIRNSLKEHPDAGAFQFQGATYSGAVIRDYPDFSYEYRQRPRGTFVSSWELVLRNSSKLPLFDERFGIGSYLGCGEEEIFVESLSRRGLKIYYIPSSFVKTDSLTTGTRFLSSKSVQRAKGGVLAFIYGPIGALLRIFKQMVLLQNITLHKRICCFIQMLKGFLYVYTHHPIS